MSYDFPLDVPKTLVLPARVLKVPAHRSNVGGVGAWYGRANEPKAFVVHTPEEDADDREITPVWFQNPQARAATHLYQDNDGDLYQMAALVDCPFAQGVTAANRQWKGQKGARAPWSTPGVSLNCQAISIEVEGRAASIHHTLSKAQRRSLVRVAAWSMKKYEIPVDRDHFVGHYELNTQKRDPGRLDLDAILEDVYLEMQQPSPPVTRWKLGLGIWNGTYRFEPGTTDVQGYAHYDVYGKV